MYKQHPDTGEWIGPDHEDRNWFLPKWHVVAFDETPYWSDEHVQLFGQSYGLYMIDLNRHVHICSFSPSYEAYFLRNEFEHGYAKYRDYFHARSEEGWDVLDDIEERERDCGRQWVTYFSVSDVDIETKVANGLAKNIAPFETLQEWKDHVMKEVELLDYDGTYHNDEHSREPDESYEDFVERTRQRLYDEVRDDTFAFEEGNPSWLKGLFRETDIAIQYSTNEIRTLLKTNTFTY